jgi:protein-tyrosine phosphatase
MSEIIKNKLYLGNLFDANNEQFIQENNITCIICVAEGVKIISKNVTIYKYEFTDDYNCDISSYLREIGNIIHTEKVVLVNCVAGISRSSTFVIAYIMKYYNLNLKKAFLYVRSKRNQICPNKKFMEYLLQYELAIFGKNSLTYEECIKLFYYT